MNNDNLKSDISIESEGSFKDIIINIKNFTVLMK
jgi:hypothetical protein